MVRTRRLCSALPCRRGALIGSLTVLVMLALPAWAARPEGQRTFASPDEAGAALVAALAAGDLPALRAIFGPGSDTLISSGDPVEDAGRRQEFAAKAQQLTRIDREGDARAELVVGQDEWPFPVPIVKTGEAWRFDTAAGKEEIINRRIGRNELRAIETIRAVVEAQQDYAAVDRDGKGAGAFASRFLSRAGKQDGLYWQTAAGEPESPLGSLVADAAAEGYRRKGDRPTPFHGYYYRMLTAQGPQAPGGAKSYLKSGRLTGGFALVAYPASYGVSGIMTFVVNQQGVVFQKNLGPKTAAIAGSMTRYDPDKTWTPVAD